MKHAKALNENLLIMSSIRTLPSDSGSVEKKINKIKCLYGFKSSNYQARHMVLL